MPLSRSLYCGVGHGGLTFNVATPHPAASGTDNRFVRVYGTKPDFYDLNLIG